MRFAALVFLAVACGPSATTPHVTLAHAVPRDSEREIAAALAKSGKLERAIAAFTTLNVKRPETRAQTYAAEVDALGALFRCDEVRDLAKLIDDNGDAEAKRAAKEAREECGRIASTPTDAEENVMRALFWRAGTFEPIEPDFATQGYVQAWAEAPSLAALLAIARTAKARGQAALAERSFERALAYAERSDQKARVAIGPVGSQSDAAPRILDVSDTTALAVFGTLLVMQDLKSGALRVATSVPKPWHVLAGRGDRVVIANEQTKETRLMRLGIDEPRTSLPLEAEIASLTIGMHAVFSADGALIGLVIGGKALVVSASTGKVLGRAPIPSLGADVVGFDDHALVVSNVAAGSVTELCTMAAPDWACVSSKELTQDFNRPAALAGHVLAMQPNGTTIRIVDLAKKKVIATLQGHFNSVNEIVLSPDASKLFSLSESRTVIWDLATRKRDDLVLTHTSPHFTPDGKRFVTEQGMDALIVHDMTGFPSNASTLLAVGAFPLKAPLPELAFEADGKLSVKATFDTARIDLAARTTEWTTHTYATTSPLGTITSPDKKWIVSIDGGLVHANKTTIEVGPDAAVFTDETGRAYISGNEASVRCVVGDDWLPLDACRDRLISK